MTPANDQGQNGTKGTTSNTTGGTGGMEPSTPAMGASGSTTNPMAGGNKINVDDTKTRRGPDASDSSASTQMASGAAAGSTGGMGGDADAAGSQQRFAKVREEAVKLRGQATDRARTAAEQGKTRATETLDGLAQAVHEAAGSFEQQVSPQVAQYVHRAADALDNFSASLRNKSVDELVNGASNFARRSPAVAIGAAVALGFALSRFLKASSSPAGMSGGSHAYDEDEDMPSLTTTRTTGSTQPRYNA